MDEQRAYIMRLLDALEVTDRDKRLKVARAILYLAQGTTPTLPHERLSLCIVFSV